MSKPPDLMQGTLDLLLLKIIGLSPQHGWAISQRLKQVSDQELQVSDGAPYTALHKLELAGWITAEWKVGELGRRAKFYTLTPAGRRRLEHETEHWQRVSAAIARVLRVKGVCAMVGRWISALRARLRALVGPGRSDRELNDELSFHV